MKPLLLFAVAFVSFNVSAAIHPGFVNLKQCVYFKDGASHRSDCTNDNTTCLSDGRCAVELSSGAYEGDVQSLIVLRRANEYHELKDHEFSDEDILDLRKSNLKSNQILLKQACD